MSQKIDSFKNSLIPYISKNNYELSDSSGIFGKIVSSWLEKMWQRKTDFSLKDIASGFLFELAPTFLMLEIANKLEQNEIEKYERQIVSNFQEKLSNRQFLDEKTLDVLIWGKFSISVPVGEKFMSVDFSKLLRYAFWEELLWEIRTVSSCLRKSEKSQILKQINLSDYQTGDALKRLFEKDANDTKNGGRNTEFLKKFLDRMEPLGSVAYNGYQSKQSF